MEEEPVRIPIEDRIDLHTFAPRDVAGVVEEYLTAAAEEGFPVVRVIHGRGVGVQRQIVHGVLSRHPAVAAFEDAPDRGATIAYLKRTS